VQEDSVAVKSHASEAIFCSLALCDEREDELWQFKLAQMVD